MKLNEMKEMSVEKWWNEIRGRGKLYNPREKPQKNLPIPTWSDRAANSGPQRMMSV